MKRIICLFLFLLLITRWVFSQDICNCWIPLDSTFQIVPMTEGPAIKDKGIAPNYRNDDGSTLGIKLPFTFCFYGQSFDTVYINNNGNISFIKPIFSFSPGKFPYGTDTLMIAPFYSDVDTRPGAGGFGPGYGLVYYKITPTYMIVKWDAVGYQSFDDDFFNTYQLIITNGTDPILPGGNNVSFCYKDMGWATSDVSGGFAGWSGKPATVGVNKGNKINYAQFATFSIPGTTYYGAFAATNGLGWLNNKSFVFNTCVTGNTIPPVIVNSEQTCDSLTICAWGTLTVTASFLSPEQGQTSTLSSSCQGVAGLSITDTNTVNNISTITVQLATSANDVGIHVLNLTATDNSSLLQTTTWPITVIVDVCSGISDPILNNKFSIYPNPGSGNFSIIDSQELQGSRWAKIYDMLGNIVYSTRLNGIKTEIDLSAKPKGIYFLKLCEKNTLIGVEKIIIQ